MHLAAGGARRVGLDLNPGVIKDPDQICVAVGT